MRLGYNTNGFAHHRLEDCVDILADIGYTALALTPDVNHLPFDEHQYREMDLLRCRLTHRKMTCVVETGARFLLDPRRKHQPTLISPVKEDRDFRRDVLEDHIDLAKNLGAGVVSFWSGTSLSEETSTVLMNRLLEECWRLCDHAASRSVKLAFEPEPGMFIDTMTKYAELFDRVRHPAFGLTIDIGHLICMQELPVSYYLNRWKSVLWNIHLDDMQPGVHDHLLFGEGTVDCAEVFRTLKIIQYDGVASVELSRHSYDAVNTAMKSYEYLKPLL